PPQSPRPPNHPAPKSNRMTDFPPPHPNTGDSPRRRVSRTTAAPAAPVRKRRGRRRSSWISQVLSGRRTRTHGETASGGPGTAERFSSSRQRSAPPNPDLPRPDLQRPVPPHLASQRSDRQRPDRQRSRQRRQSTSWPATAEGSRRLPKPPTAPRPIVYVARTLIIGVAVAAITGTLLSVFTPADTRPGTAAEGPAAAQTESAITAEGEESLANTLGLTRELAPLKAALGELPELTPGLTPKVFWVDLDTGAYVNLEGQQTVASASTIKLPILVALFEAVDAGKISLEQTMRMQPEQVAGGSGDMQNQPRDTQYTVLEVATQMIINSDNTATNMMIDLLGGNEVLNARFAEWGLTSTVLNNPLPDLEGTNTTSPRDLVKMLALLHRGEQLTLRSRDRIFNILQRTYNKNLLASGVDEAAVVYNKTGDIGTMLGDVALVDVPNGKRYAIAALVTRPENDGRARELIRRFSQTVYQVMNSEIVPTQSSQLEVETVDPSEASPTDAGETLPDS
ncbi:MAG: serine hydrolase, partial [Cyanobacteria bacterium P01_A01_bin.105]